MKVYRDSIPLSERQPSAVTFGNFDGMHHGHQQLLHAVIDAPETSTVVLFDPLPEQWFKREGFIRLMPLEQQIQFLKEKGVGRVLCLTFDDALSHCSAEKFIVDVLREVLRTKRIYVGQDACFGYRREGNIALLENENDIEVHVLRDWVDSSGVKMSSTRCRNCLLQGNVLLLNELLNRQYSLTFSLDATKSIKPFGEGFLLALEIQNQWALAEGVYAVHWRYLGKNIPALFWAHKTLNQAVQYSILLPEREAFNTSEVFSIEVTFIDSLDRGNFTHPFLKDNKNILRAFYAFLE